MSRGLIARARSRRAVFRHLIRYRIHQIADPQRWPLLSGLLSAKNRSTHDGVCPVRIARLYFPIIDHDPEHGPQWLRRLTHHTLIHRLIAETSFPHMRLSIIPLLLRLRRLDPHPAPLDLRLDRPGLQRPEARVGDAAGAGTYRALLGLVLSL